MMYLHYQQGKLYTASHKILVMFLEVLLHQRLLCSAGLMNSNEGNQPSKMSPAPVDHLLQSQQKTLLLFKLRLKEMVKNNSYEMLTKMFTFA